jgi:hypothetical protein
MPLRKAWKFQRLPGFFAPIFRGVTKCMLFSDRYTVETTEHFEKEFKRMDRYTQRTMALSDGGLSFDLPDPRQ